MSASSTKALQAPGMTFYEMSLINIQFELDEVGSRIELLQKNKLMVDSELNEKVNLHHNLEKKVSDSRQYLNLNIKQVIIHLLNMGCSQAHLSSEF